MTVRILVGDARDMLATLPSGSVQCAVTSPPYFGLRSYLPDGHPDKSMEIGLEQTPDAYVATLVNVFREMRRVLADDGVFWLNIGDSYAGGKTGRGDNSGVDLARRAARYGSGTGEGRGPSSGKQRPVPAGYKHKDLLMIPARVALALQADGWYLRSHCIWHKPNPMPESVRDRPTSAHESVFLLTKNARYFYNADAVREPHAEKRNWPTWEQRKADGAPIRRGDPSVSGDVCKWRGVGANPAGRNMRNVWTITEPTSRLRGDLTEEQRRYVITELMRRSLA